MRTTYAVSLLLLICTSWLILKEAQVIQNLGDMARFGATLFQVLAPLQLLLMMFLAAISTASNIAIEKDRQTLILLMMSRLTNSELVLGKLFASLLDVIVMLMTSLPIFMMIVLFGGVSFEQVGWTYAVTIVSIFATGSLGALFAFWREKTFQTLALVGIAIVFWVGLSEAVSFSSISLRGYSAAELSGAMSPIRAIIAASLPTVPQTWPVDVFPFLIFAGTIGACFCLIAILRVRRWNPNREVRPQQVKEFSDQVDVFTGQLAEVPEGIKQGAATVSNLQSASLAAKSRNVWSNPILWREVCTWAYGKKIVFIRAVYWLLALAVLLSLYSMVSSGLATRTTTAEGVQVHVTTKPLAPFVLLSIVMVNALAVTSITTERDGKALDLLRVSDISPKEFLLGKTLGVLAVAGDMVLFPIGLSGYLWFSGVITLENWLYLVFALLIINVFATILGIHCGMLYAGSRQAILVSLGTVFFLFLGVVTCMLMMISFAGNVEAQLTPFLACIFGGGIGLYLALGWNMPSLALGSACGLLPFAMFHAITSYLLGNFLTVFIVIVIAYGFAVAAMAVPRLSEFLVASDRVKAGDSE
jgi:ABC-type transport system involved in multi-copper enzyme maturation permease subunit